MRPFFHGSVALAVEIFAARDAADAARAAAAEYLMFVAVAKPRSLRKSGIAASVLTAACEVAAQHRVAEDPDDAPPDPEDERAPDVALRVLDAMARRAELSDLVFGAVVAAASALLKQAAVDTTPADRSAHCAVAYRITGVVAEGCADQVSRHAQDIVGKMAAGALDGALAPSARADALEALALVCEALDTDEMQETVISAIGGVALNALLAGIRHPVLLVRRHACMALEPVLALCLVDVPTLQPRVAEIIGALGSMSGDSAVEAVMAIGILAENAPEEFVAYKGMPDLIQGTLALMSRTDEDGMLARAAGIETAGALVAVCDNPPIIEQLAAIAAAALEVDEPNIKRATFSFFARMADAVGGKVVAAYGPKVLQVALESMARDDVIFEPNEGEEDSGLNGLASAVAGGENVASEDIGSNEEDATNGSFHVRTAFLDEKMLAISVCGAFAAASDNAEYVVAAEKVPENAKMVQALLSKASGMIDTLSMYFHEDVRAATNKAGVRMAIANVRLTKLCPALKFDDSEVVSTAVQRLVYSIEEDDDPWVVTNVLNAAAVLCDELPPEIIAPNKTLLLNALQSLINGTTVCQADQDDDGLGDGAADDEAGDASSGLVSGIGDVVEALVRNQRGLFAQDFFELFPKLLKNMFGPSASARNKSMVFGAVAGVLLFMNWERCRAFQPPAPNTPEYEAALRVSDQAAAAILPHALDAIGTKQGRGLQRNAIFLIGIIFMRARASNEEVWSKLPIAIQGLQEYLLAEKSSDNAPIVDNAAGAVARIIISPGLRPGALGNKANALQLLMGTIPMEGDPAENTTVARAVMHIAEKHPEKVVEFLNPIVSCLTSAVLFAMHQAKIEANKLKFNAEKDENDEMVKLTEQESAKMVAALSQIRTQYGDAPFNSLGLSPEDGAALANVVKPA